MGSSRARGGGGATPTACTNPNPNPNQAHAGGAGAAWDVFYLDCAHGSGWDFNLRGLQSASHVVRRRRAHPCATAPPPCGDRAPAHAPRADVHRRLLDHQGGRARRAGHGRGGRVARRGGRAPRAAGPRPLLHHAAQAGAAEVGRLRHPVGRPCARPCPVVRHELPRHVPRSAVPRLGRVTLKRNPTVWPPS